jgi:hypothetical protein
VFKNKFGQKIRVTETKYQIIVYYAKGWKSAAVCLIEVGVKPFCSRFPTFHSIISIERTLAALQTKRKEVNFNVKATQTSL